MIVGSLLERLKAARGFRFAFGTMIGWRDACPDQSNQTMRVPKSKIEWHGAMTMTHMHGERENLSPRFGGSGFSLFSAEEGGGGRQ